MTTTNIIPLVQRRTERSADRQDGPTATAVVMTERAVYTVKEVSELLSLSLGSTYALVREGTIPAKKIGGRWVIPKRRFHAWLDECTQAPADAPWQLPDPGWPFGNRRDGR